MYQCSFLSLCHLFDLLFCRLMPVYKTVPTGLGHFQGICLITLAGLPATSTLEGTSLVTTEPAPTVTPSPMVTPLCTAQVSLVCKQSLILSAAYGRMMELPPLFHVIFCQWTCAPAFFQQERTHIQQSLPILTGLDDSSPSMPLRSSGFRG